MLIPLEPLGVGTAECESLSSYVQRLAAAQGSRPGELVFRLLAWLSRHESAHLGEWAPHLSKVRLGVNMNSFAHADHWVATLGRASSRVDLGDLTTRSWDWLFPSRHFQAQSLAWCAPCLAEDQDPYHRLGWLLQPTRCCPKHRVPLQDRCARCDQWIPVIHDRSAITRCPWCAGDLRIVRTGPAVDTSSFDFWCARQLQEIIVRSRRWHDQIEWRPCAAFRLLCSMHGSGTSAAFARFLDASKLTTWYWLTGRARPTLRSTLQAYHRCGVDLAAHLFSTDPGTSKRDSGARQAELRLRPERHARQIDWDGVRVRLLAELKRPLGSAPSFISVAASVGIARRTLRAHEPKLCRRLTTRWRSRRQRKAQARDRRLERDIGAAVRALLETGESPSQKRIEQALGRPGLFNSHYARRALRIPKTGGERDPRLGPDHEE